MKKEITLLILAGGMGSRFGGLKQIEPLGPNGEFIIDYSIYDAIKAGFTKVVFLIKRENDQIFRETIGKRVEPHIKVEYAYQENDNIHGVDLPKSRTKPYGTAHAVLCCKDVINENFAMINADDFYGRDAFIKAYEFLTKDDQSDKEQYGLVPYLVKNTLTEFGSVKRGLCFADNNRLEKIVESSIEKKDNVITASPLDKTASFNIDENDLVSMNVLLFKPSVFEYIEEKMPVFFQDHKNELETCEFLIPDVLTDMIKENYADVNIVPTNAVWHGITYKEDTENVRNSIKDLVDQNVYSNPLWTK